MQAERFGNHPCADRNFGREVPTDHHRPVVGRGFDRIGGRWLVLGAVCEIRHGVNIGTHPPVLEPPVARPREPLAASSPPAWASVAHDRRTDYSSRSVARTVARCLPVDL